MYIFTICSRRASARRCVIEKMEIFLWPTSVYSDNQAAKWNLRINLAVRLQLLSAPAAVVKYKPWNENKYTVNLSR